jgi:hypothetical protein
MNPDTAPDQFDALTDALGDLLPRRNLHSLAARWAVLMVSTWGALFGLFVSNSLIYRLHDRYDALDWVNGVTLAICALGWADILWHDIRGKLIWPSFKAKRRHRVCVMAYSLLGATWVLKAFGHAAITDIAGSAPLAIYALSMSTICGMVAVAIALEKR